ncbi:MAG: sigma-70 family RNA polymerase sigma factor [Oscillospiraceae bacterium]|nr:sigma-70 family RNA polymerase sigma factor [Oscillospiraceae bacterium]
MVQRYAKKILGFAYGKTRDIFLAEDLSQDIMLALVDSLRRHKRIDDLDGYVYTVCCYTWSKYLRGNKKHWHNLDVDAIAELQGDSNPEDAAVKESLTNQLRTEIAYLSQLHRRITVMFWFEGKTGAEIARLLNIPASTVRWHVSEIKKKLKEGIEMETNLSYEPKRLMVSHWGNMELYVGLGSGGLPDNICIACYGKALTIEEISKTLSVAAAYLEPHIQELVYMDYLRVVEKNKYITNFLIEDGPRESVRKGLYQWEHIAPYAERLFAAFDAKWERIREIGFLGSELDRDFLYWALISVLISRLYYMALDITIKKHSLTLEPPERKDGSRHWIFGTVLERGSSPNKDAAKLDFTPEQLTAWEKTEGNGVKTRENGFMLDSYYTNRVVPGAWRDFEDEPNELNLIADIIRNGRELSEADKLLIAKHVKNGYVEMENGRPRLMIPVFTRDEHVRLEAVMDEIAEELGADFFVQYFDEFRAWFDQLLPTFLPENDRSFHKFLMIQPHYAIVYKLNDAGLLRTPSEEEAKRLCVAVWSSC